MSVCIRKCLTFSKSTRVYSTVDITSMHKTRKLLVILFYLWLYFSGLTGLVEGIKEVDDPECKSISGKLCQFPFIFGGTKYFGCATDPKNDTLTLCPTKLGMK